MRPARTLVIGLISAAVLGAALVIGSGPVAQAAQGQTHRIQGGVEDGTFKPSCLSGASTNPSTEVLDATTYRRGISGAPGLIRILVPWNIVLNPTSHQAVCLHNYLVAARGKARIEISLNRRGKTGDDPSVADYRKAVNQLKEHDGTLISYLTAWNEPNNKSYLNTAHPASKAGHFYLIANKAFPGKVVAGDFASGVSAGFLGGYLKALGKARPRIWAIHPYTDDTNFQFYLSQQPARHKNPVAAASRALRNSKTVQFATLLGTHHYGAGTQIWINEIYVDHTADKCSPTSAKGTCAGKDNCQPMKVKRTCVGKPVRFSLANQGYAALFISGGLGRSSLPGVLAGKNLPQLTRYVYLRAEPSGKRLPDATVLRVQQRGCVYNTLAGSTSTPAAACSS